MAKINFKEDWERLRCFVADSASRKYSPQKRGCTGCHLDMEIRLSSIESELEAWEKCFPKPRYSRDELLIEIAKRLNIEL